MLFRSAKAMIGNDEVADILPLTDRSIYVLGKKMGTTSLTLFDSPCAPRWSPGT